MIVAGQPGDRVPSDNEVPATFAVSRLTAHRASRDPARRKLVRHLDVHVKGVFFLTQALLPLLAKGGRIVDLSSGLTRTCFAGYAAAKGAVEVPTRSMAKELGARGIAVDSVAPGAIETDFGGGGIRDDPEISRLFVGITALGRAGRPDDFGAMIASLLSEDNR